MPPRVRSRSISDRTSDITIVGAGMAGLAAALRALEAGRSVTLIEGSPLIGGKFGAVYANGSFHEIAYHFFADWCLNFWELVGEIGLDRQRDFAELQTVTFLEPGGRRSALHVVAGAPRFWADVHSGVLSWRDMFVYLYSVLDLLADEGIRDDGEFLNRVSVNGYMRAKGYMTDPAALLHNETLFKVFAVPSFETSARAYRRLLQLMSYGSPSFRVLRGNCYPFLLAPLQARLEAHGRAFQLRLNTALESIELDARSGLVRNIAILTPTGRDVLPVRRLILAVPHQQVAGLLEQNADLRRLRPDLRNLRLLRAKQMASLDLVFKTRLSNIPEGHVTLLDWRRFRQLPGPGKNSISSDHALSFIDNSVVWNTPETRLNVVASDFDSLAGVPAAEARLELFRTLQQYLDIDEALVDWDRSLFLKNARRPLFVNTAGSWEYRPEVRPERGDPGGVANLFLAGDYCRSEIDMPSVEAAIVSGELAAWRATDGKARRPLDTKLGGLTAADWSRLRAYLDPWLRLVGQNGSVPSSPPPMPQVGLGSAMSISAASATARPA